MHKNTVVFGYISDEQLALQPKYRGMMKLLLLLLNAYLVVDMVQQQMNNVEPQRSLPVESPTGRAAGRKESVRSISKRK